MNILKGKNDQRLALIYCLIALAFWTLRFIYWGQANELPFSDLEDYRRIGETILKDWDFAHSRPFWLSYKPPGLPLLIALYYLIRTEITLDLWPLFQSMIQFGSVLFLCHEIFKATKKHFFSLSLFAVVALSESSIFWSYKTATESLSESFLYLTLGLLLSIKRKQNSYLYFVLGISVTYSCFIRPQSLLAGILICGLALMPFGSNKGKSVLKSAVLPIVFGVLLTWAPWGIRGIVLYNQPVLFSTQGPYSFLWELGSVEASLPDGRSIRTDVFEIQRNAPQEFANDFAAMNYWQQVVGKWVVSNFARYPRIVISRIGHTINGKEEFLSKIPRHQIFEDNFINSLVIHKISTVVWLSLLSTLGFLFWSRIHLTIAVPTLGNWAFGAFFLGSPRIIDPILPLLYFFLLSFLYLAIPKIRSFLSRQNS